MTTLAPETGATTSARGDNEAQRGPAGWPRKGAYGLDHLPTGQETVRVAERSRPRRSLALSNLFDSEFEGET
jgi:hypothetical protein